MTSLPQVRTGLLSNQLDDQVLVYDPRADSVHLLDPTTARVMELLADRGRTTDEIVVEIARQVDVPSGKALLALAIDELRKADLLDESVSSSPQPEVSRRELLRKVALAGAAAVIAPAIVTLSPSPAYAQGSCLAKKDCCTVNADCCSNKCDPTTGSACPGTLECH
jgi:PqqD family protein of HPr-rel-A system